MAALATIENPINLVAALATIGISINLVVALATIGISINLVVALAANLPLGRQVRENLTAQEYRHLLKFAKIGGTRLPQRED